MGSEPTPLPHVYKPYVAKDGTVYKTTRFHYYQGDLVLCPVCDCRPCDEDCTEQRLPRPRREPPGDAQVRVEAGG